jgi:non-canonical purine NTP pyrophosphatase (RdgB/HAM1 family)
MIKDLTFITGRQDKVDQLSRYLGIPIKLHKLDLDEIQSLSAKKVSEHKVRQAYEILKVPVIVDDTSFYIKGMNNFPGPLIKFFMEALDNEQICNLVSQLDSRDAVGTVDIGFYDGKELHIFTGEIKGYISDSPRGDKGFGWDRFFIPAGYNQTRAEMTEEDYDKTSPRKFALEKFEEFVSSRL